MEYERQAIIHSRIHILAPAPRVTFNPHTYPSLQIEEQDVEGRIAFGTVDVTLIGTAEQRHTFAVQLREVADAVEAWTEAVR